LKPFLLLLLLGGLACSEREGERLLLFAASSARDALTEFEVAFEAEHPGVNLLVQNDASSRLRIQIDQGAGAHVFLSANSDQLSRLERPPISQVPWARNQLVVALAEGNPAGIHSLEDLGGEGIRLVRAQDAVPAGAYALEWLGAVDETLRTAIVGNIISLESNVRQVRAKLALGEVDAAFLYKTDLGTLQSLDAGPLIQTQMALALLSEVPSAKQLFEALQDSPIWARYGFGFQP
jgi:molybdate transport system substrate-binding protein